MYKVTLTLRDDPKPITYTSVSVQGMWHPFFGQVYVVGGLVLPGKLYQRILIEWEDR